MIKKLIITGAAAGLLLVSATGAFADDHGYNKLPTVTLSISNTGSVSNKVDTSANTGYNNEALTGGVKDSGITTGDAAAAADVTTQLNFNQFDCGCVLGLTGDPTNLTLSLGNSGSVSNVVDTSANTGYNNVSAGGSSKGGKDYFDFGGKGSSDGVSGVWITTGMANAGSTISNIVNTNVFGTTTP